MSAFIESQRAGLEEIDTIESAIAQRFKKNPSLVPEAAKSSPSPSTTSSNSSRKKRSQKEGILQQHELAFFHDNYKKQCKSITEMKNSGKDIFQRGLEELTDKKHDFTKFDDIFGKIKHKNEAAETQVSAEDINKLYSPYSSGLIDSSNVKRLQSRKNSDKVKLKVKRKDILSVVASHIDIDAIFHVEEVYGKYLALQPYFDIYKVLDSTVTSYVEYLNIYDKFPSKGKSNSGYSKYLEELLGYLIDFIKRSQPFIDVQGLIDSFVFTPPNSLEEGKENEQGEVYCKACDKLFTKLSVYQGHLGGKKHKKNLAGTSQPSSIDLHEFQIKQLSEYLKTTREATISNAERKSALTEREKIIDMNSVTNDDEYTTVDNMSSDENDSETSSGDEYDDSENLKDVPLGLDGKPMPFWLYKLQGLHKTYSCEICGNITYKGRMNFAKHFTGTKHQYGLKCLGISDEIMPLFKSIIHIEEAIELWNRIKREKRIKAGEAENAIEVEDDQGNVMSEKDYLDLKKQGLL